jgi:hypothetical protein
VVNILGSGIILLNVINKFPKVGASATSVIF